jgi:hypothetical protein
MENTLPFGSKLLSIILYSDATNCDTLGKSSLHPIYITLGNISTWRRNKPDAKQLLGYLPIIKSSNISEKRSQNFKNIVREAFHKSMEIILEPLISLKNGIDLSLGDKTYWFFPKVSVIIADWPEAATFCLTFKSPNSNNPCHFCLVTRNHLSEINLSKKDLLPRTHENMKNNLQLNTGKSVSIENVSNFFWKLS